MTKLRRMLQKKFDEKQDALPRFPGELGDGKGNVKTGVTGMCYVRIAGIVNQAVNETVPYVHDLKVWVGYLPEQPLQLKIISQRVTSSDMGGFYSGAQKHAASHEWFGEGSMGGTDIVKVRLQQFMPLRVMPYSGLEVMIYPGIIYTGSNYVVVADTNVYGMPIPKIIDFGDISTYPNLPANTGLFDLITIDTTGAIVVTEGNMKIIADLGEADIPAPPAGTRYMLAAIRRYNGQSVITESRMMTDIVDLRYPMPHFHTLSELSTSGNFVNWTPNIIQNGTVTHTVNYAKYTLLGGLCFIDAKLTATGSGTAGYYIQVKKLPKTPVAVISGTGLIIDKSPTLINYNCNLLYDGGTTPNDGFLFTSSSGYVGNSPSFALASGDEIHIHALYPY